MKLFGLIGHPLSHSYSKAFFTSFFAEKQLSDHQYELFDLNDITEFKELVNQNILSGLNVTLPFKKEIIKFLDETDPVAEQIQAVNCISFGNGKLKGHNTDQPAFLQTLKALHLPKGIKALVFGTGGSAAAVTSALTSAEIPYRSISRYPGKGDMIYHDLNQEILQQHHLLINCTPVGMHPYSEVMPEIPMQFISGNHIAYDLIYNPEETLFLRLAKQRGAGIKNGKEMLELQALLSWEIWKRN